MSAIILPVFRFISAENLNVLDFIGVGSVSAVAFHVPSYDVIHWKTLKKESSVKSS